VNPKAVQMALVLVAIGAAAFLAFLLLVGGCAAVLPTEPPFTVTMRDAGR
jgi:hypothetical protein